MGKKTSKPQSGLIDEDQVGAGTEFKSTSERAREERAAELEKNRSKRNFEVVDKPTKVRAIAPGWFGKRIRQGEEFVLPKGYKIGTWMEVIRD